MQTDPKKKEQKVESTNDKKPIEPTEQNDIAEQPEHPKSDDEGYVVVESGLGIDE